MLLTLCMLVMSLGSAGRPPQDGNVARLHARNFDAVVKEFPFVFVNFGTPWCVWCQRFEPMWQDVGLRVSRSDPPWVLVGKVDCMAEERLCKRLNIGDSYPKLLLYRHGAKEGMEYKGERQLKPMLQFLGREATDAAATAKIPEQTSAKATDAPKEETAVEVLLSNSQADQESLSKMKRMCEQKGLEFGTLERRSQQKGEEATNYSKEYMDFFLFKEKRIAPSCSTPEINPRGWYDSYLLPCEFKFHQVTAPSEASSSNYHLSSVCNDDNVFSIKNEVISSRFEHEGLSDYVRQWPDECVGDFTRCYSVTKEAERNLLLTHFCGQAWAFPLQVTHVSVSCQDDKILAIDSRGEKHRTRVGLIAFILVLVCGCSWMLLWSSYRLVILPYLRSMKKSRSDPDLKKLLDTEAGKKKDDDVVVAKRKEETKVKSKVDLPKDGDDKKRAAKKTAPKRKAAKQSGWLW